MSRTPEELKADQRKLAAETREKIAVVTVKPEDEEKKEVKEETKEEETKEEIETKEEKTEKTEEKEEKKEEEIETKEETLENNDTKLEEFDDEKIKLEKEKKDATTDKEKERVQKRIDRLSAKTKSLEAENDQLKKQLEASKEGKETFTEEDVQARAKLIATEEVDRREFANMCSSLEKGASKLDKDFGNKIDEVTKEAGKIPSQMISVLHDLDNGAQVLVYFSNDVDEYERVKNLSLTKMSSEVTKISLKLAEPVKPKVLSKVPPPIDPIRSGKKVDGVLRDNEPMDDWVAKRNAQVKKRAEDRAKGLIR